MVEELIKLSKKQEPEFMKEYIFKPLEKEYKEYLRKKDNDQISFYNNILSHLSNNGVEIPPELLELTHKK